MIDKKLPPIDDEQFDLLVDGELPEAQRRRLLASLDETPGAWRRCALAFLETQSWKEELGRMASERPDEPPTVPARRLASRFGGRLRTLLAMAACFLMAFVLGLALRDAWRAGPAVGPEQRSLVADRVPNDASAEPGPQEAVVAESALAESSPVPATASPWRTVTLAVDGGPDGETEFIHIPAREWRSGEDPWRESMKSAIPPSLLEFLNQRGYRFQQDHRLVPVPLKDGRQLVVPMDLVEVDYEEPPVFH
jgi:hypothetical protein